MVASLGRGHRRLPRADAVPGAALRRARRSGRSIDLTVIYAARDGCRPDVDGRAAPPCRLPARCRRAGRERASSATTTPSRRASSGRLAHARPDCVVVSGWSTFASQAAIAWCRVRRVPYLLIVESHDDGPRAGLAPSAVKETVVPPIVRGAAGVLVTGTLARRSMLARGARPERVRVFANTIDVERVAGARDGARPSAGGAACGLWPRGGRDRRPCVARRAPEKGIDTLEESVRLADGSLASSSSVTCRTTAWSRRTWPPTSSRSCRGTSPGAWSSTRPPPAGCR